MPEMIENAATRARDGKLRKRLMSLLYSAREMDGMYAVEMYTELNTVSGHTRFASIRHCRQLLRDLCGGGYVECRDVRGEAGETDDDGAKMLCRVTTKGVRYEQRLEPVDPLVPDGRLLPGHRLDDHGNMVPDVPAAKGGW